MQQNQQRRLWFRDGFWWYSCPVRATDYKISSLIRNHGFRRDRIARSLGLSERSFHRLIKDSLDVSPGIWLRRERAVSALYRLRDGSSVKQLAFEFGFKHPGDFTNEFKHWYGVTPHAISMGR
jgi:AraC-like DNA-binding protein